MSLNADILLDRIHLKQQATRWRLIAIVVAVIALIAMLGKGAHHSPIRTDYIARITIEDVISDDRDVSKLIRDTAADSHARAVLVWLNTPGGSAVGGQQLYLDLRAMAKKKPVVAVMRSMATSAGYLAALGTDHIVAREGTITGSIGVLMEAFEATELAQKLGIRPITLKSGPNKAAPNPLEKFTPEQERVLQTVIKDFYDWFVDMVADRRHLPRDVAEELSDGRIYTGRQAVANKLIDAIGGEEEAIQWLEKEKKISATLDVRDVKVERENPSLFETLTQMLDGKIGSRFLQKLDGLSAIWQPNSL